MRGKLKKIFKLYYVMPVFILMVIFGVFILWQKKESTILNVAVMNKTVSAIDGQEYRKHMGLYWILDYLKIRNEVTEKEYDYKIDYFGPKVAENNNLLESNNISKMTEIPDILYLSDAYGDEQGEQNGITYDEMNMIYHCYTNGSVIVGEQDIMSNYTDIAVVKELENIFGIKQTGWVGRYVHNMSDLKDIPTWLIKIYEKKYGKKWDLKDSGMIFVSKTGDIVVLDSNDFVDENFIKITTDYKDEYKISDCNYYNWFELIESDYSTEVIASYTFNVNPDGKQEMSQISDKLIFPAVTRKKSEDKSPVYYFAGDFNDCVKEKKASNFYFADIIHRLTSFERVGDVEYFYWNFYEPLMDKILKDVIENPITKIEINNHKISRIMDDKIQVFNEGNWNNFNIKGFNINGESPGDLKGDYSRDFEYYNNLVNFLGEIDANTVRVYDLLPPEFYRALYEYNKQNTNKIYLIQGICADNEDWKIKIKNTVKAVNGKLIENEKDSGVYFYNMCEYLLAYIIDPKINTEKVDSLFLENYSYDGKYLYSNNSVEAYCSEMGDYLFELQMQEVGYLTPISISANTERLSGASWTQEEQNTFNLSLIETKNEAKENFFVSYSLKTNDYPVLNYEEAFQKEYSDEQGEFAYGGYIKEIKSLCTGNILIDKVGFSTNTNMFEQNTQINGISEKEQGDGIVRILKAASNQNYLGVLISDLNDDWSSISDNNKQFTKPISASALWHDVTDIEQTTGVVAVEADIDKDVALELSDNHVMNQMQITYNEEYLYISIVLDDHIDYDANELILGIDTYQRNNGEYYYDKAYFANSLSGMEYVIKFESKLAASLYVAESYNRNNDSYSSKESYNAQYDLVSVLEYGDFSQTGNHFYQSGPVIKLRLPWAMIGFANPQEKLVINGHDENGIRTQITDGMIFSLVIGDKETKDTAYIFPETKEQSGYNRFNFDTWNKQEIDFALRKKESFNIIKNYYNSIY